MSTAGGVSMSTAGGVLMSTAGGVSMGAAGVFVVFEGGDGVGKTTQVDRLCGWLADQGREVVRTFEPGDTPVGRHIRQIVLDPATGDISPRAEALLYAADKAQHLYAVVRPALARGAVVVCDRYVDSMIAYQGAGRVLEPAEVEQVARWATQDLQPQLTVLLDVDHREAVSVKADKDRLEAAGDDFHARARGHFLALAGRQPQLYLVLNARDSREEIARRIADRVAELLSAVPGTVAS
jgi:dTMP kinase